MRAKKTSRPPAISGKPANPLAELPVRKPALAAAPSRVLAASNLDDNAAWQQAHDALELALEQGNRSLDQTRDKQQRKTFNALLDTISNELTALNQEDMRDRTLSLQAASQQLGAGIESLKALRQQIAQIADDIADAAKVVAAVDGVLSGLQVFLATFPAL